MPATVIAQRLGWTRGLTVFKDRVRELRPAYLPANPASRTTYEAGELVVADLQVPTTTASRTRRPQRPPQAGSSQTARGSVTGTGSAIGTRCPAEVPDHAESRACRYDCPGGPRRGIRCTTRPSRSSPTRAITFSTGGRTRTKVRSGLPSSVVASGKAAVTISDWSRSS